MAQRTRAQLLADNAALFVSGGNIEAPSEKAYNDNEIDSFAMNAIVVSSNTTAVNDQSYVNVANATYTDPSPAEGKGYSVFVRNGTATIGAVAYSSAGTVIYRIYHSGSWSSYTASGVASVTGNIVDNTDPTNPVVTSPYTKDADGNVFYDGVSATLGTGCTNNTFQQGAGSNVLGNNCTRNTFSQDSFSNTLGADCVLNIFLQGAYSNQLGANCASNTFGQGARDFIFGSGLSYTTIAEGATGADYTTSPDYDFLYTVPGPSQIFFNSGTNYHSYVDPATNRIVLTNLTTLDVTFIGNPGIVNILREDFITLAGAYSTTSLYRIADATPGPILLDPAAISGAGPDYTFSVVTNETALLQGTYYLGTTGNADDTFIPNPVIRTQRIDLSTGDIQAGTAIALSQFPAISGSYWNTTNVIVDLTAGATPYTTTLFIQANGATNDQWRYALTSATKEKVLITDMRTNGDCFPDNAGMEIQFSGPDFSGDGSAIVWVTAELLTT